MLRLTLIRHANAEWKDSNIPDFDRPLNKRGMSSGTRSAKRTQQTAEIVGRMLGLATRRVKLVEQLYLARAEVILAFVHQTGPKVHHLAIVGHNPGISELARGLAPEDAQVTELATACACTLTFATETWLNLEGPAARAVRYEPPAKLFNLFS